LIGGFTSKGFYWKEKYYYLKKNTYKTLYHGAKQMCSTDKVFYIIVLQTTS